MSDTAPDAAAAKGPKAKVNPDYKVGETVIHIATGDQRKLTALIGDSACRLQGVANVVPLRAISKL